MSVGALAAPGTRGLARRAARGGAHTLAAQVCKLGVTVASTAVLARLVAPAEWGAAAMVTAVVGFFSIAGDLGLSAATIQRERIADEDVSTLFWINTAFASALSLLACAAAPAVAWFYQRPELHALTLAYASLFVLTGLAVQHRALLRRAMRFGTLASIEVGTRAAGAGVAIGAALHGLGTWALFWGVAATAASSTLLVWLCAGWRPGLPRWRRETREMVGFGWNLARFNLVNYFARNLDDILIGRVYGGAALGLYSRGYALLLLPLRQLNAPLASVAVPTLSRLQTEPERLRRYYLEALRLLCFAAMPIVGLFLVLADEIVQVLLGPDWREAATILRLMGVAAVLQTLCNTAGWLYVATGRTREMLRWGIFATGVIVASFLLGLPHGIRGVALAYSIAIGLLTVPCMYFATRTTRIGLWELFERPLLSLLAAGVALGPLAWARLHAWAGWHPLAVCIVGGAGTLVIYLGVSWLLIRDREVFFASLAALRGGPT